MSIDDMDIKTFHGLNNVSDPLRLGLSWLAQADNLNISSTGALSKRDGYSLSQVGAFSGAFTTFDFSRGYLVAGGSLKTFDGVVIKTGLSSDPMYWTEVNNQVFFNNGTDSGVILPDNSVLLWRWEVPADPAVAAVTGSLPAGTYQVCCTMVLPDGRETGTSDSVEIVLTDGQALQISGLAIGSNVYIAPANSSVYQLAGRATATAFVWNASSDNLGRDLLNFAFETLPLGCSVICAWRGRIYVAQYMPVQDQTVVWFSEPLGHHLFSLNSNFVMLPGRVLMLAPHTSALVIGTGDRVFAYDGTNINQIADYGVVPGQHWAPDDERILFWSKRGLCAALPFTNLTERQVSVAPGIHAGGCVVRSGGQKRYVAAIQQGGSPFNSFV